MQIMVVSLLIASMVVISPMLNARMPDATVQIPIPINEKSKSQGTHAI